MKVAVFADTHGNRISLRDALSAGGTWDALIHLGDGVREAEDAARESRIQFIGVSGNEDTASELPRSRIERMGNFRVLLMHGDRLDLNPYDSAEKWEQTYRGLAAAASMDGAHAVFFGHTHRAVLRVTGDVLICNPGDMYIGSGSPPSYAELEILDRAVTVRLMERDGPGWRMAAKEHVNL